MKIHLFLQCLVDQNRGQAPFLLVHKNDISRKQNLQGFQVEKSWLRRSQKNGKRKKRCDGGILLSVVFVKGKGVC